MKTKNKKYYVMFEMHHSVCYSSVSFKSFEDDRRRLEMLKEDNEPFLERIAVGYWEEFPNVVGNLKIFHICCECRRLDK